MDLTILLLALALIAAIPVIAAFDGGLGRTETYVDEKTGLTVRGFRGRDDR